MPSFNEGKFNKPEQGPKVIDTEKEFWYAFVDAKNQFQAMTRDLTGKFTLEELKDRNHNIEYLSLEDYLLKNKNSILDPKIIDQGNNRLLIAIYNNLIDRVKNFETTEELHDALMDVKEYIKDNPDVVSYINKNVHIEHDDPKDMTVKNIETEHQFWLWLHDSLVQFHNPIFRSNILSDEEIIKINKNKEYLTYREWLAKDGRNLSQKILNNSRVKILLDHYDNLISRIKGQDNIKEIHQVMEEAREFFQEFKIGIDE